MVIRKDSARKREKVVRREREREREAESAGKRQRPLRSVAEACLFEREREVRLNGNVCSELPLVWLFKVKKEALRRADVVVAIIDMNLVCFCRQFQSSPAMSFANVVVEKAEES